jgi:hypothetical protein
MRQRDLSRNDDGEKSRAIPEKQPQRTAEEEVFPMPFTLGDSRDVTMIRSCGAHERLGVRKR